MSVDTDISEDDLIAGISEKYNSELHLANEIANSLSEALRIDYIEKWKIYAELKLTKKELAETQTQMRVLKKRFDGLQANFTATSKQLVETRGGFFKEKNDAESLREKNKELRKQLKELKEAKKSE